MRIDAHVHVIPGPYREALERRDLLGFPLPPADVDGLLAMMDRHAIDAAVVSPSPPGVSFGDQGLANELARLLNEELAHVARDSSRFAALATLPLPDVDAALAELRYALDELEMDGVMLMSNVLGTYLGDSGWDPLFDELNRRRAYVFVHPQEPHHPLPLPEHPMWLYEFPFDTTRAVVNLIYSGTVERHRDVNIQLAHLGGAAPYLGHRIASLAERSPEAARLAPAGALEYLARFYYDTGLADNDVELAAMSLVTPADHIVFGTDWPYAPLPPDGDPQPALAALGPGRAAVDAGNIQRLLPRFAPSLARDDSVAGGNGPSRD
jgi:predicted TIM-barrel fold metal-dependent hydrolase